MFGRGKTIASPNNKGAYAPYPLFIDLNGARVVVVGAGKVASRKIKTAVSYGALVDVVAPQACDDVKRLAECGDITWLSRRYESGDVVGARYVVCATDDRSLNERVYRECMQSNTLVNVVDDPELCNAIVPAVVRRGNLQIAVSTGGAAPSLARKIRLELEDTYAQHWEDYVDLLGEVRSLVKERVPGPASKRMPLYAALTSSDIESRFAAGERPDAEQIYNEYIRPLLDRGQR